MTNIDKTRSFVLWVFLTLFSVVSMTSMTNFLAGFKEVDEDFDHEDWTTEQRWAFSVAAISVILSFTGCVFHLVLQRMGRQFAGENLELGMVVLILVIWCAGLPTILDRNHNLAVQGSFGGQVLRHNMFFASWGALISALLLFIPHLQIFMERQEAKTLHYWFGLCMAGLIVMCDSSRIFKNYCEELDESDFCRRSVFGLSLGAITFVFAGCFVFIPTVPLLVEQVGALFSLAAWCCGLAYLTFEEGNAVVMNTVYCATWAALFFSVLLFVPFFYELFLVDEDVSPPDAGKDVGKVDIENAKGAGGDEVEEEEVAENI